MRKYLGSLIALVITRGELNMSKHTKGPWIKDNLIVWDGYNTIAEVKTAHEDASYPEFKRAEANARLIAAAPEMLEALKYCKAYFEKYKPKYCGVDDDRDCSPFRDLMEAIKKAEGRE